MRNSLILKLMGAFMLVIAIGALVISVLTSQATQNAFTLYTTRSGQTWAQRLAPELANYYARANTWQGFNSALLLSFGSQIVPGGMGMGAGQGRGTGRQSTSSINPVATPGIGEMGLGMGMGMGQRLLLTDAQGIVIADTQEEWLGKQIASSELKSGAAILVGQIQVGTILVTPAELTNSSTPAGEFLASVNQALVSSAVIAGCIALLLGTGLFLQITSPLRQLKKAAAAIASGDLAQRVSIRSRDEFGELGQTFNHMAESLANAETQRRHMVADVAHELRTPLAAIQGTLEGMQDGVLPLDEEQLAALYTETMLLNRLVGDLKLLSLAEAGQLVLERQETEPRALIEQIVERARPQADQKNVHLETDLQPDLPVLSVDSDRITQVLNNLIGNALRYTPADGTIRVRGAYQSSTHALEVSVTDNGQGISPDDLPFVFDRFYRADKSRTRGSGGSGLGLAIVKQLIEAHGGRITVESPIFTENTQTGPGTKFTIILPVQK